MAVWICSNSWRENHTADPLSRIKNWIWKRRMRRMRFQPNLKAFVDYRGAGSLELPLSDVARPNSGPSPRAPGSPFQLRLQQFMQLRFALTEDQAWDYPYGLAKMRWTSLWEQEGKLEVYNHHDAQHDQEYEKFLIEQEKEGNKLCQAS